jgi:hypothetical protein
VSQGPHPSPFELDRAIASGQLASLEEHLASCAQCAAHVKAVQARQAIPERLLALAEAPSPRRVPWAWLGGALGAVAALVVSVVLVPRALGPLANPYVGAKGGPGSALYVKRGDQVFPWAPPEQVRPGDLLRLVVVPDGFSHLTVATPGVSGWIVLFDGAVAPEREFELPASWRVDGAGAGEELLVVLSRRSVRPEDLPGLAVRQPRTPEVWTSVLQIEKIGGR